MDTSELQAAFDTLTTTVERGGFGRPPDPSAWTAEQVLAHLIATNRGFTSLGAALLAGRAVDYDNAGGTPREHLDAIVDAAGGWDGLLASLRQSCAELVGLAGRMDDASARRTIQTVIRDGGTVIVDRPGSLEGLVTGHTAIHLPLHLAQLEALRAD